MKFDFGTGKCHPGAIGITPDMVFTPQKGYGFDLGFTPKAGEGGDFITGEGGFYFSVQLPEGNYDVSVLLGDPEGVSDTTIKSESRRLMVENLTTAQGQQVTRKFTVNIRQPDIRGGSRVGLKEREKNYLHWDSKLTLEFNGPAPLRRRTGNLRRGRSDHRLSAGRLHRHRPALRAMELLGPDVAAVFQARRGGGELRGVRRIDRQLASARRVAKVESLVKNGDYVFIQFGHNDMKSKKEDALQRYEADLTDLVKSIRAKGGTPVLVTSMERKRGVEKDTLAGYPDTVIRVAAAEKTALIDLHAMSRLLYEGLGENLDAAFQDGTHHNNFGSYELAKCVVEGIRKAKLPLASMIADDVKPFDPAHPDSPADFRYAASPLKDMTKPDGN